MRLLMIVLAVSTLAVIACTQVKKPQPRTLDSALVVVPEPRHPLFKNCDWLHNTRCLNYGCRLVKWVSWFGGALVWCMQKVM
jgi:hypothetical protein